MHQWFCRWSCWSAGRRWRRRMKWLKQTTVRMPNTQENHVWFTFVYLNISPGLWREQGRGSRPDTRGSSPAVSHCDGGTSWPDGGDRESAAAGPLDRSAWAQSHTQSSLPGPAYKHTHNSMNPVSQDISLWLNQTTRVLQGGDKVTKLKQVKMSPVHP